MRFEKVAGARGKSLNLPLRVASANNFLSRAIGLLATRALPEGCGLLITPCKDVHTWFMRFSIDVIFLSSEGKVLGVRADVKPFRFVLGPKGTASVLELAAGVAERAGIAQGDILTF